MRGRIHFDGSFPDEVNKDSIIMVSEDGAKWRQVLLSEIKAIRGYGERGLNLSLVNNGAAATYIKNAYDLPCILLALGAAMSALRQQ